MLEHKRRADGKLRKMLEKFRRQSQKVCRIGENGQMHTGATGGDSRREMPQLWQDDNAPTLLDLYESVM